MASSDNVDDNFIHLIKQRLEISVCPNGKDGCNECTRFAELKDKIQRSLEEMSKSLSELQSLKADINQAHSSIIEKIPAEITSTIFELSLPFSAMNANDSRNGVEHDVYGALVRLGGVCRLWREIAGSTPRFWDTVLIRLPVDSKQNYIPLLRDWIARSKSLPLTLTVVFHDGRIMPASETFYNDLFKVLASSSNRWRFVNIKLSEFMTAQLFAQTKNLSLIHTLKIITPGDHPFATLWTTVRPRPHTARIWGFSMEQARMDCGILTRVEVGLWEVSDCIELVHSSPMLEECKFRGVSEDSRLASPTNIVNLTDKNPYAHPNMRILDYSGEKETVGFFSHFSFPSLTTLSCHFYYGTFLLPELLEFENFLKRSCSSLDSLRLYGSAVTASDALNCIYNVTPVITTLRLSPDEDDDMGENEDALAGTLLALSRTTLRSDSFLSRLEILEYSMPLPKNCSWDLAFESFGPLEEIGQPHRRPFKLLEVRGARFPESKKNMDIVNSKLRKLEKAGARIRFVGLYSTLSF